MNKDLTRGPVMRSMLLFAVPMILGNLLQQCYNIADTLIVGQFLGKDALAAVGSSFTLMTFLISILLGLCMGSGALFSIRFGQRDGKGLREGTPGGGMGFLCADCGIGCLFLLYGLYRALGRPGMSVVPTVISLGSRVALAYGLSAVPSIGVTGIWWSVPIGWALADITGILYYILRRKQLLSWEPEAAANENKNA